MWGRKMELMRVNTTDKTQTILVKGVTQVVWSSRLLINREGEFEKETETCPVIPLEHQ